MGLFLQKTNIIRDYLEDYVDGRAFWPQDVWKKHAKTGQLGEFALPQFRYVITGTNSHQDRCGVWWLHGTKFLATACLCPGTQRVAFDRREVLRNPWKSSKSLA